MYAVYLPVCIRFESFASWVTWEARAQVINLHVHTPGTCRWTDGDNMAKRRALMATVSLRVLVKIHKLLSAYFGTANTADRVSDAGVA